MKSFIIGTISGIVVLLGVGLISCESAVFEGIGIGAAGSKVIADAEQIAKRKKVEIAQELIDTRAELEVAIAANDTEKQAILVDKIGELSKKDFYAELSTFIIDTTSAGTARDWTSSGNRTGNLQWILGAGLGIFALYEKRRRTAQTKGIAKFSAQAEPRQAELLYDDIKKYSNKIIP